MVESCLAELRSQGYSFFELAEIASFYERFVVSLVEDGYDDFICEFEYDMEFWDVVQGVIGFIKTNGIDDAESSNFMKKVGDLDVLLKMNTIPVPKPFAEGLPWWYYVVLKRGRKIYVNDVKESYGLDIELVE